MGIKRRDFLKLVAGSAMTLPLFDCSPKGYHSTIRQAEWLPNDESWFQTVCLACPGGCGVLVRVVDGKAVKIEGDPSNPINRGTLCAVGQSGLQYLYNPDRIKGPLKKVGGRDSGKWEPINWEEAIELIVTELKSLKSSGEMNRLVLLNNDQYGGMLGEILDRFMTAFGSPNHFGDDETNTLVQAFKITQGIDTRLAYDIENSNYILSFGSSIFSSWPSPIQSMRAYSHLRQGRPGRKAKIVQIEPRFSITASRSDTWIPINPGTEGMLALGIAYVIIKENLYDTDYVEKFTFGFDNWRDRAGLSHKGFKSLILEKYRSDAVSEATGVPVDQIVNLAKEFAASRPAVAVLDESVTNYSNGLYSALAIHSLNALVGSVDEVGGVLVKREVPLQELPPLKLDQVSKSSLAQPCLDCPEEGRYPLAPSIPSFLPKNILDEKPYSARMLMLNKSNPLFSSTQTENYRAAFDKIPFIVSFSTFMDESTEYADLILPDKTYLEKYTYVQSSPVSKIAVLGLGEPVIDNLYNTKPTEDVFLEIAQKMGGSMAENFPWKNSQDFLSYKIAKLPQTRRGILFTDQFEETQLKLLQDRGWWVPQFDSDSEFLAELQKRGGWWDPSSDLGVRTFVLRTPSRKFEFYSQLLVEKMEAIVKNSGQLENTEGQITLKTLNIEAEGDDVYMPHYETPRFEGQEEEFPYYLHIYRPLNISQEYQIDQPWIQEVLGFHLNMTWDSWAEINPETAKELDISDEDLIWIESTQGKIHVKAKIYPGAMPDVISVPYGLGHKALGRWAKDRGVNPMDLVSLHLDELTGLQLKYSNRIKVYKA